MIKEVISFDFDGTLFYTPEPNFGKVVYKKETGLDWPHRGWWSRKETLDTKIFHIPMNNWVYNKYLEAISKDKISVLVTGRLERLRTEVEHIIDTNGLFFHEVHLNTGGDTLQFKKNVFENLINQHNPDKFTMYDDRHEHLIEFKEWSNDQKCEVDVIDINTKKKI